MEPYTNNLGPNCLAQQQAHIECGPENMPREVSTHRQRMARGVLCAVGLFFTAVSFAAAEPEYTIKIINHQFVPAELHIPAGMKVRIVLDNQDDTAEEFDSHSLNREKHLPAKSQATIFIGPLAPGRYIYEGESEVAGGPALGLIVVE